MTQSSYTDDLKAIPTRIRSYLSKCDQNLWSTSKTNVNRLLTEKNGLSNNEMSSTIVSIMSKIYPSMLWQSQVYKDISGGSKHWFTCSGCFSFLHFQSRYNVVVAAQPTSSKANSDLLSSFKTMFTEYSNSPFDAHTTVNILAKYCFTGLHVIERSVDEWTDSQFGSRHTQTVGSKHTIVAWAVSGVGCPLKPSLLAGNSDTDIPSINGFIN